MYRMLFAVALALLCVCANPARAADGDLDPGWTTDAEFPGFGFYPGVFGVDKTNGVEAVLPAAEGRVYLVGNMQTGVDSYRMSVYRLLEDGLPDYSFGIAGLRTYVTPCAAGRVTDAALDPVSQRLWLLVGGCGDFLAYRLSANGELDTSLLGTGVLQVAFDLGGGNADYATRLLVGQDGGVLVAGAAETGAIPSRTLAFARVDASGQAVAGFGVAGKSTMPLSTSVSAVNSLHRMADGRIVATGYRLGNGNTHYEFAARIQSGGQADASFGADGPGFSLYDPLALPDSQSGRSGTSVLLEDGSILRIGSRGGDFYLGRWLADGQRDLALGPLGLRTFALDFGGTNSDAGVALLRQGDGRLLLIGVSNGSDGWRGISLMRLRADLSIDSSFGIGGKRRHIALIAADGIHDMSAQAVAAVAGRRILVGANVATGEGSRSIQSVLGLESELLFADSFE